MAAPAGRVFHPTAGAGETLGKGVFTELPAVGLSIKPGGAIGEVDIAGGIVSRGPGMAPLKVHGEIGSLRIAGGGVPPDPRRPNRTPVTST